MTTWMFLCKRSSNSILIVNKFNLPNFKYLMWVFAQALIINIPLLNEEIGRLQDKGQFFFFACEKFFPNPPLNLSLLEY